MSLKLTNTNKTSTTSSINRKYGFIKQPYDSKDVKFDKLVKLKRLDNTSLPGTANNRRWCSAVEDQGQLGSCTANAWCNLLQFNECKGGLVGKKYQNFSRLFVYYNERVIEGTVSSDSGATLRDGSQVLSTQGVCPEGQWQYIPNQFAIKPTAQCYTNALQYTIKNFYALTTLNDMKTCIANGYCFVFGFNVYTYFESQQMADTGVLYMPQSNEQLLGGHAVMACAYNDSQQRFLIKNSWGTGWGLPNPLYTGFFTIPYTYLTDASLSSDFWTCIGDV